MFIALVQLLIVLFRVVIFSDADGREKFVYGYGNNNVRIEPDLRVDEAEQFIDHLAVNEFIDIVNLFRVYIATVVHVVQAEVEGDRI